VILRRLAQRLTQKTLALPSVPRPTPAPALAQPPAEGAGAPAVPTEAAKEPSVDAPAENSLAKPEATPAPQPKPSGNGRPPLRMNLINRAALKTASETDPEVEDYFEVMPMNWATVLPLFDRNHRVCGIFLFEGVKPADNLPATFSRMMDLSTSAGRALGTALYWNRQPALRLAQRWVRTQRAYIDTPRKKKFLKFGLPVLLLGALLVLPIDYTLKGDATVLPVNEVTLPTLVGARLVSVAVREGESVKQGQILAQLDTRDLELQLRQVEQDYNRSLLESQTAQSLRDEARMQMARIAAEKSHAIADKLRLDIARCTLRAPIDGIVLGAQSLSNRLGEVLRVGEPALEVVDPSAWQVKVSMREQDLIYLSERLDARGKIPVTLSLAANPAHKYLLEVSSRAQIAFGLDTARGKYDFSVVLPLETTFKDASLLKSGFGGQAKFSTGRRPTAYVFFRDFINYLRVRFF